MTYAYNTHGAPAVGGGLPGLPQRGSVDTKPLEHGGISVQYQYGGSTSFVSRGISSDSSRDGAICATARGSGSAGPVVWKSLIDGSEQLLETTGTIPTGSWNTVAVRPDGKHVAMCSTASENRTPQIFSVNGDSVDFLSSLSLVAVTAAISGALRYSPDGKFLAVADVLTATYPIQLYRISGDSYTSTGLTDSAVRSDSVAFSPDSKYMVFNANNNLRVYDVSGEAPVRTFSGSVWQGGHALIASQGKRIEFLNDGSFVYFAGDNNQWLCERYRLEDGVPVYVGRLSGLRITSSNAIFVRSLLDEPVLLLKRAGDNGFLFSLAPAPTGDMVVCGGVSGMADIHTTQDTGIVLGVEGRVYLTTTASSMHKLNRITGATHD